MFKTLPSDLSGHINEDLDGNIIVHTSVCRFWWLKLNHYKILPKYFVQLLQF